MNKLFFGDNLDILREHIADESVDLIYLDPPFNSKRDYSVLFKTPKGHESDAQITAFEDSWHWGEQAEREFNELLHCNNTDVAEMMLALRKFLKENDMMAYLTMMANRLLELHRVLKPTGSLYLHCDPTASHYLKIILDGVFGHQNFKSEVVWKRTSAHSGSKRWGPVHDIIFFYTKTDDFTWNNVYQAYDEEYIDDFYRFSDAKGKFRVGDLTGAGTRTGESGQEWRGVNPTNVGRHWGTPNKVLIELFGKEAEKWSVQEKLDKLDSLGLIYWPTKGKVPGFKRYYNPDAGVAITDVITDIDPLSAQAKENLPYPTQKPLALLERIIKASSNESDVILDPFCGCGTAVHAAEKLRRQWIGIDITHLAISLIEKRLKDAFPGILFEVEGTPKDIGGARNLAERHKYQFQWWATSLVGAQPYQGKKKGADSGIDGLIFFHDDKSGAKKIVVSVKGGENVSVAMVRDFAHVIEREQAAMGFFVTLAEPTGPMSKESVAFGFYDEPRFGAEYPKLQILTIEGLMSGTERPRYPDLSLGRSTFKKAAVEEMSGEQERIF